MSRSRSGASSAAGGSVAGGSDTVVGVGIASVGSGIGVVSAAVGAVVGVLTGVGTAVGISVGTEVEVGGFSDSCPHAIKNRANVAMPSEIGDARMVSVSGFTLIRARCAFAVRKM